MTIPLDNLGATSPAQGLTPESPYGYAQPSGTPQPYYAQPEPVAHQQPYQVQPDAYQQAYYAPPGAEAHHTPPQTPINHAQPYAPAGYTQQTPYGQPAMPAAPPTAGAWAPPYAGAPAPMPPAPPAARRKRWPWVAGGVAAAVLALGGAAVAVVMAPSAATPAEAKRACETAFITEMDARDEKANTPGDLAVSSVNGIDVAEPHEIEGGFEVFGTGHYTIVTPSMSLPGSVELTCTAKPGDDGTMVTTVTNRAGTTG